MITKVKDQKKGRNTEIWRDKTNRKGDIDWNCKKTKKRS